MEAEEKGKMPAEWEDDISQTADLDDSLQADSNARQEG